MSKLDKIFAKHNKRKEMEQKALEIINNKKQRKVPVGHTVPKTMRDKVEYAKMQSQVVFADKLDRLECVTDLQRIDAFFENVKNQGILALDTETNGLDRIDGKIAGI